MYKRHCFILLACLLFAAPLHAAETIQTLRQQIDAFNKSADYALAPATAAKAQAYLGAAMLAADRGREEEQQAAIASALASLDEARSNAARFREKNAELLELKNSAELIFARVKAELTLKEPNPEQLLREADEALNGSIKQFENGELGASQQSAESAKAVYKKAVAATLPALTEKTGTILSRAAAASARNYAPKTYAQAKEALGELERFVDGLTLTLPANPAHALSLAELALEIAQQVKILRKSSGSHEEMILGARHEHQELARALGIEVDASHADIGKRELATAIEHLKSELAAEKAARQADRIALKQTYEKQLEEKTATLLSEQSTHLSQVQEAFRAKLERETFEAKRQKQIRSLFKNGEVEILVNVDGSLLIRLTKLRFASGSSKIAKTSLDLLGRLKKALDVYSERKVRIEGHTDNTGDVKLNQKISLKRAESVRDFLIKAKTDGSRLKALGYGEVRPIASNEFEKGRAMNRRIDIVIEAPHD